jgi:hypothetical protein
MSVASMKRKEPMSSRRNIVAKLKADAECNGRGIQGEEKNYDFVIEDCKRHFGKWDICDPVSWAILRVVQISGA